MAKKPQNNTIKYKYIFKDDYNTKYANGAYGGVTPRGEISVNFYCERQALPKEHIHSIDENGNLGEISKVDPPDNSSTFVRVVDQGIIINLQTAKDIVKWLQTKIDIIESINKQVKNGSNTKK